ncbi:DUF4349 domain-containing protein [Paenibacillus kobensis]|uniref:DUF4349 domain-containing protein n=1 Tax=Paenibacillus kobensis TaxID=59841 RepID=UPI0013E3C8F2|nr:DUF4349 domain-containing protein [Paenibacillus kobensis]
MRLERKRIVPLIGLWLAVFLLTASLAACGSGSDDKSSSEDAKAAEASPPAMARSNSELKNETTTADAATGTASQTDSGIADTSAMANVHRQVIYTANLQMQVRDFASARNTIDQLIISSGGYLLSFAEDESSNRLSGSFKIKVPAKGFDSFIDSIDKLPDKKLSKNISGEDVTEEYADLSARLKAKEAAETRLFSFMESAKTSKDLVSFSNELAQVQEAIEQIKGRMRYIDQNVDYSTVDIDMYQTLSRDGREVDLDENPGLMTKAGDALRHSADMIVALGRALVIAAAFLLPLLPFAAIVIIIIVIVKRRRRQRAQAESETRSISHQNDNTPTSDDHLT